MLFYRLFEIHSTKRLQALYVSVVVFSFALSLITIFEPIFLYGQGFPIWAIGLYYALHYGVYTALLPLGGSVAARFGLERAIVLSLPFCVLYSLCLVAAARYPVALVGALAALTIHKILYWPASYTLFARSSDAGNRGTEISWLNALRSGAGILGPIAGGYIAGVFGFSVLFATVAVLVFVSGVPLLCVPASRRSDSFSLRSPWKIIWRVEHRKAFLSTLGWAENLIDSFFWPLFLFIVLGSLTSLGTYLSLALAITAIGSFFIADIAERYPKDRVLRAYLPFMIIGYALRIFGTAPVRVVLIDGLARMSFFGVTIPQTYRIYSQARTTKSLDYMVAFEMVLAFAKTIAALCIVLLFLFLPVHAAFVWMFVLGGIFAMLYGLL